MSWGRIIGGGIAAGIVTFLADFVQHGMILGKAYAKYPVFTQTAANPGWFLFVSVSIGICVAILFAKSRGSWAAGWKGGAAFGFFLGLATFFSGFYNPLVLEGFPYHLAWCWGGVGMIDAILGGAVLGALIPRD